MTSKKWIGTAAVFLMATVVVGIQGCKDDPETIATITVLNAFEEPVANAEVYVYFGADEPTCGEDGDSSFLFDTCGTSNATGKVSWNFSKFYKEGQSGFAVLDILAEKGALVGLGIINVEEKATTEETVILE